MTRHLIQLAALLTLATLPSSAWAVTTSFQGTNVGTQDRVTGGTISFEGDTRKGTEKDSQQTIDRMPGPFDFTFSSMRHWTQRERCNVGPDPTTCGFMSNPVYPFQNNAPPFGVINFTPVFFGTQVNNLTLKRQQIIDTGPNFKTSQNQSRQQLGELNNAENYPLTYDFVGVEILFGGPQINVGIFQLNVGIGGLLGGIGVNKQTTSRVDNADSNQGLNVSGFAGGTRIEGVLSAPGWRLFGSGILALRGTYTGLWGNPSGGTAYRQDGDLTAFGLKRNQPDDTQVDFSLNRISGELILVTLGNHLGIGVGGGMSQTTANTSIVRNGIVGANTQVEREIRDLNRSTQGFGLVSLDLFVGNWCGCFAPLGARFEAQIGPDNFGVFGKVTWMFGVNGRTIPQMISDSMSR